VTLPNAGELDYLAHLARESARFAEVMSTTAPDAPVPPCPDWTADDLLWHLGEVQWFWGTVVRDGLAGEQAEALKPARPASRAGLQAFYATASRDLGQVLAAAAPQTPAWTWADDHTVGFIRRRQAHEALIHRVDAELTAGRRTPLDRDLSADGVDEALRIMYGGIPEWGMFTPYLGQLLRIRAADTADSWFVTLGQFAGADPADGKSYDQPGIDIADGDPGSQAAATITGRAADLDCWLWHRPQAAAIDRAGDPAVLSTFDSVIAAGIN